MAWLDLADGDTGGVEPEGDGFVADLVALGLLDD